MKFLILEDDFSYVMGYTTIIQEIFDGAIIHSCDNVPTANWDYMLHLHNVLLIDDMVNGRYTGIGFLKMLKKRHIFQPLLILCVSSSSSLKCYEGKLFDKYTGKDYAEIKKALLKFKENQNASSDTTMLSQDPL